MVQFTTRRERNLWIAAIVVVAGIFALMGVASSLSDYLQDRDLISMVYWAGLWMVVATIVMQVFRIRLLGIDLAVIIGIIAVYLLVFARMWTPAAHSHLIEYGVLAALIYEALRERGNHGRPVPRLALVTIGVTTLIGVFDECIQFFVPDRVLDPVDMLFNFTAATLAVGANVVVAWLRKRIKKIKY